MNHTVYDYLNQAEMAALEQAETTRNMLREVAFLRMENEELKMKELKRLEEINMQFNNNNAFIGGFLKSALEFAEHPKS